MTRSSKGKLIPADDSCVFALLFDPPGRGDAFLFREAPN